uniref:Cold shock domain-containing protein E1 n=1 Tax=Cacopsylla melanoneura TaxID=428564 RepID=A0A8D8RDJ0_9HEMI
MEATNPHLRLASISSAYSCNSNTPQSGSLSDEGQVHTERFNQVHGFVNTNNFCNQNQVPQQQRELEQQTGELNSHGDHQRVSTLTKMNNCMTNSTLNSVSTDPNGNFSHATNVNHNQPGNNIQYGNGSHHTNITSVQYNTQHQQSKEQHLKGGQYSGELRQIQYPPNINRIEQLQQLEQQQQQLNYQHLVQQHAQQQLSRNQNQIQQQILVQQQGQQFPQTLNTAQQQYLLQQRYQQQQQQQHPVQQIQQQPPPQQVQQMHQQQQQQQQYNNMTGQQMSSSPPSNSYVNRNNVMNGGSPGANGNTACTNNGTIMSFQTSASAANGNTAGAAAASNGNGAGFGVLAQGFIAALKDGFGFIETDKHDREVFFHFSNFDGEVNALELGLEVEYTLGSRNSTGGSCLSAENVRPLPKGTISHQATVHSDAPVYEGIVMRPLRSVNPDQAQYSGLVKEGTPDDEGKEYEFGILSLVHKRDLLQIGDPVQFQVDSLNRAANLVAVRQKFKSTVNAIKGLFGFLNYELEEGKKLFFHTSEVKDGTSLGPGDQVEFVLVTNHRTGKSSACNVVKINENQVRPERLISRLRTTSLEDNGPKMTVTRQPRGPDGSRGFGPALRAKHTPGVL